MTKYTHKTLVTFLVKITTAFTLSFGPLAAYNYQNPEIGPRAYLNGTAGIKNSAQTQLFCFYLNPACLGDNNAVSFGFEGNRQLANDQIYGGAVFPFFLGSFGLSGGHVLNQDTTKSDVNLAYGFPIGKIFLAGAGLSLIGSDIVSGQIGGVIKFPGKKDTTRILSFADFRIGFSLLNLGNAVLTSTETYPFTMLTTFSFQLFDFKYVKIYPGSSLEGTNHFEKIYFNFGAEAVILKYARIGMASHASAFLNQKNVYAYAGLKIPIFLGYLDATYTTQANDVAEREHLISTQFYFPLNNITQMRGDAEEKNIPILFFSPDNNGIKDWVSIENIKYPNELLGDWCVYIVDAATNIYRNFCSDMLRDKNDSVFPMRSVVWDGITKDGVLAPDGYYHVRYIRKKMVRDNLNQKNRRYEVVSDTIAYIVLRTKPIPGQSWFSQDKATGKVTLMHQTQETEDVKWRVAVLDEQKNEIANPTVPKFVNSFSTPIVIPDKFLKPGKQFRATLTGEHKTGVTYSYTSKPFITEKGIISIESSESTVVMSEKETKFDFTLNHEIKNPKKKTVFIFSENGTEIFSEEKKDFDKITEKIVVGSHLLEKYPEVFLNVRIIDAESNEFSSNFLQFSVLSDSTKLKIHHSPEEFTIRPDTAGFMQFHIASTRDLDVADWNLFIYDSTGQEFGRLSGNEKIPKIVPWSGKQGDVVLSPLSDYTYELIAKGKSGKIFKSNKGQFSTGIFVKSLDSEVSAKSGRNLAVALPNLLFEPGSAAVRLDLRRKVLKIGDRLKQYVTHYRILIEGHTDNRGDEQTNLLLSLNRAKAVKEVLVSQGINRDRILTEGLGSSRPAFENDTPLGQDLNRRVEITLVADKDE